jgi:hypothetical protein
VASRDFPNTSRIAGEVENVSFNFRVVSKKKDRYAPLVIANDLISLYEQACHHFAEEAPLGLGR